MGQLSVGCLIQVSCPHSRLGIESKFDDKWTEMKVFILYLVTALAEIAGCYLPYLWLKQGYSAWLLIPAAISLGLFAWLLTLHPVAAGRVYAAYGGVYIATAIFWLWLVDGIRPTAWDIGGATIALAGMAVIYFAPVQAS